jgi:hypothetical protein
MFGPVRFGRDAGNRFGQDLLRGLSIRHQVLEDGVG